MIRKQKKQFILIITLVIILIATLIYAYKRSELSYSEGAYRVISYDYSVCTMDIPTSSCGQYEVEVESLNGTKDTFIASGFEERKDDKYNQITEKIHSSKKENKTISIKINKKKEIISVN